ncbi:MAG TPA: diguanylate cyclase [Phycisphaerae bacterium]|nr:diguanylate cyclase [Phycisphaerales bacterium]HRX86816.1 diguanylate cyclase [Phycisphaerae bacterium]
MRILLVDDEPQCLQDGAKHLIAAGHEVLTAGNAHDAIRLLMEHGPPILITDWHMPGMTGVQLCRRLRHSETVGFLYVIVLTSRPDTRSLVQAFEAGADDFLTKPVNPSELLARLRAAERIIHLQSDLDKRNREVLLANARMSIAARDLEDANNRLRILATTDELTGLLNRREAMNRLGKYWAMGDRHGEPLAVIMVDIDHFKQINDNHGHAVGDLVLRELTQTMRQVSRSTDEVCRIGGEEFLIICPHASMEATVAAAERLRGAVATHTVKHRKSALRLTISLGVAERTATMGSIDDLLHAADEAMYVAKSSGRNCTRSAGALTPQVAEG